MDGAPWPSAEELAADLEAEFDRHAADPRRAAWEQDRAEEAWLAYWEGLG